MNRHSPAMRDLAQRLVVRAAAENTTPGADHFAVLRVCEALRRPLVTLAGATGFRTLLARALTLAKRRAPELAPVQVGPDGVLQNFPELPGYDSQEAGALLIGELLTLLDTFIGEALTVRIVLDLWPDMTGVDASSDGERRP